VGGAPPFCRTKKKEGTMRLEGERPFEHRNEKARAAPMYGETFDGFPKIGSSRENIKNLHLTSSSKEKKKAESNSGGGKKKSCGIQNHIERRTLRHRGGRKWMSVVFVHPITLRKKKTTT